MSNNHFMPNMSVSDGFDFVKKMWGGLPMSGMMGPVTDLNELDKRIADLKAVEQWLNVNMGMLKSTIQGLEIQRGAIVTMQSFGASLSAGASSDQKSFDPSKLQEAMSQAAKQFNQNLSASSVSSEATDAQPKKASLDEAEQSSKALISNAAAWWGVLQEHMNQVAAQTESTHNKTKPRGK